MLPVNAPKNVHHNNHHDGVMNFMHRDEEVSQTPHSYFQNSIYMELVAACGLIDFMHLQSCTLLVLQHQRASAVCILLYGLFVKHFHAVPRHAFYICCSSLPLCCALQVNYFPSRFDPVRHSEKYPYQNMKVSGNREKMCIAKENNFAQAGARWRSFDPARQDRFINRIAGMLTAPRVTQVCPQPCLASFLLLWLICIAVAVCCIHCYHSWCCADDSCPSSSHLPLCGCRRSGVYGWDTCHSVIAPLVKSWQPRCRQQVRCRPTFSIV